MRLRFISKAVLPRLITALLSIAFLINGSSLAYANLPADKEYKFYYYLHDNLGGIQSVLDDKGNVVCTNDYLPYGEERNGDCMDKDEEDYGFTGKEKDEETGLMYYGARYYDPVIGRFTSMDPVTLGEGSKSLESMLKNPQALNPYSYALNNPLKYKDETGEYAETAIDAIFLTLSLRDFYMNPGIGTAFWVGLDAVGTALPVPSVFSYIKNGARTTKIVSYFSNVAERTGKNFIRLAKTFADNVFFKQSRRIWTEGAAGDNLANLIGHAELHSTEVGAKNLEDYYNKANDFIDKAMHKWEDKGDLRYFDPKTQLTAIEKNGNIATFYKVTKESDLQEYMKKVEKVKKAEKVKK